MRNAMVSMASASLPKEPGSNRGGVRASGALDAIFCSNLVINCRMNPRPRSEPITTTGQLSKATPDQRTWVSAATQSVIHSFTALT